MQPLKRMRQICMYWYGTLSKIYHWIKRHSEEHYIWYDSISVYFSKMEKQTSIRLYITQTNHGRIYINLVTVTTHSEGKWGTGERGVRGRLVLFLPIYLLSSLWILPYISTTYSKQPDFFTMPMYYLLCITYIM